MVEKSRRGRRRGPGEQETVIKPTLRIGYIFLLLIYTHVRLINLVLSVLTFSSACLSSPDIKCH